MPAAIKQEVVGALAELLLAAVLDATRDEEADDAREDHR